MKRKVLLPILAIVLVLGLTLPVSIGVAANSVEYIETLYLSDSAVKGDGKTYLFEVELDGTTGRANLTLLPAATNLALGAGEIPFEQVDALACTPDGTKLYAIDKPTTKLGYWDLTDDTWHEVANTGISECVLAAFDAGGTLYAASDATDSLYTVDTTSAASTLVGVIKKDGTTTVNVSGADIVFGSGPTLYLWANTAGAAPRGLYTLALPASGDVVTATHLGEGDVGSYFTGLAIRGGGAGDLVGSTHEDEVFEVDKTNGNTLTTYAMYKDGSPYDYEYGDMTIGELEVPVEPELYDICGYKYADWEGELIPLPNWDIELWAQNETGDWGLNATTTTDEDGKYCFTDLPAGNYSVKEVLKDGWEQVYPEDGHIVTLPLEKIVVYGTERATGNIWEVDATTGDATLVFTAPEPPSRSYSPGSPNGLAYDTINDRLYYTEYLGGGNRNSDLYFYDGVGQTFAGTLTGTIACADFYAGKYYYIAGNPTDDLYEVTFNADGTVASKTKLADISSNIHSWTFGGDIAISPDGVIYGLGSCSVSGHGYEFFKVNRDGSGFEMIKQGDYSFSLQLAFGSDGTLYGHESAGDGLFYAVDLATGDLSPAFPNSTNYLYTDLASGQSLYNFVNAPELECSRDTAWARRDDPTANNSVEGNPSNAWGWTNWVTGNTTMDLWAGAGQNDITKGTLVGTVTVTIEDDCVTVEYSLDIEAVTSEIVEAHLWIGDTELPMRWVARGRNGGSWVPTAAPGQFPYHIDDFVVSADGETATIEICGVDDAPFWVAAHAVVEWCDYNSEAVAEIEAALENGD